MGMEAIEVLRFLASLPLAGTGQTEGGEKTQPFNRFHSRLFILSAPKFLTEIHPWIRQICLRHLRNGYPPLTGEAASSSSKVLSCLYLRDSEQLFAAAPSPLGVLHFDGW